MDFLKFNFLIITIIFKVNFKFNKTEMQKNIKLFEHMSFGTYIQICWRTYASSRDLKKIHYETLTKQEVENFLVKNGGPKLNYKNKKDKKDQTFHFDGEKVVLTKKNSHENTQHLLELAVDILNSERNVRCPFSGCPLPISAAIQGYEFCKSECHIGHQRNYFAKNTLFPPVIFNMLPQTLKQFEADRIFKSDEYKTFKLRSIIENHYFDSFLRSFDTIICNDLELEYYPFEYPYSEYTFPYNGFTWW